MCWQAAFVLHCCFSWLSCSAKIFSYFGLPLQIKLIHIHNSHPDLLYLKTSQVTSDENYKGLYPAEQLAIWERAECIPSLKRNMLPDDRSMIPLTFQHYCEEWWFKLALDIRLNMTHVLAIMDDVMNNYLPSLQHGGQSMRTEPTPRPHGTIKIPQRVNG